MRGARCTVKYALGFVLLSRLASASAIEDEIAPSRCVAAIVTAFPLLSQRLIATASSAPLYVEEAFPSALVTDDELPAALLSRRPFGNGFFTKTVSTPISIPNDHAVTSYGGSGGEPGERRTSGEVCFSRRSFAYRAKT